MKKLLHCLIGLLSLIGTTSPVLAGEEVTYYHNDLMGSPIAATDAKGHLMWRQTYEPYGERIQLQNDYSASIDNKRGFTSHVQDVETGLVYMQTRHYDPIIGRFLSADPVGFKEDNVQTFNRYAYGNNNPFKYVDPDGRASVAEIIDAQAMQAASEGSGLRTYGWAFVGTTWSIFGAEPVSQVYDKGADAGAGNMAMAGFQVVTTVAGGPIIRGLQQGAAAAARGAAAGTKILVNSAGEAQLVVNGLKVGEHAALRMTQRGVSIPALENTLSQTPFKYFHDGVWKTGFYDPASRVFAGSINGEVTTIINGVKLGYIENLMRAAP